MLLGLALLSLIIAVYLGVKYNRAYQKAVRERPLHAPQPRLQTRFGFKASLAGLIGVFFLSLYFYFAGDKGGALAMLALGFFFLIGLFHEAITPPYDPSKYREGKKTEEEEKSKDDN